MAHDVWVDASHGESWFHISGDLVVLLVLSATAAGISWRFLGPYRLKRKNENEYAELLQDEAKRWRLTDAEKQVTSRILKGQSFLEIARELGKSERTVRQQAISVYRKAGLHNRSELTAYFLSLGQEKLNLISQMTDASDEKNSRK